jgi:hypothetical protein
MADLSDDSLIAAMLGYDLALAAVAKRLFDVRHAGDIEPRPPAHCDRCFEGCSLCQPGRKLELGVLRD